MSTCWNSTVTENIVDTPRQVCGVMPFTQDHLCIQDPPAAHGGCSTSKLLADD